MVRPKKHLGQHFLVDQNIARKITALLKAENAVVLEIGPGTGTLTQYLIPRFTHNLWLVEIDTESVEYLKNKFPEYTGRIIEGDFLQISLNQLNTSPFAIIGNFPYNISSQIFFHILTHKEQVQEVVCMIQKEVAERIAAGPGSKTYGILSVLLQTWYEIEYCFTINETVFHPPPKVKSAVIRLTRNSRTELECNTGLFQHIVKMAFNQRRKTLRNALRSLIPPAMMHLEILNKRAEQLSISEFIKLTNYIEQSSSIS